jgi:hypothetical protein
LRNTAIKGLISQKLILAKEAYLLRVIVDDNVDSAVVVAVYKTSKIKKYWREL